MGLAVSPKPGMSGAMTRWSRARSHTVGRNDALVAPSRQADGGPGAITALAGDHGCDAGRAGRSVSLDSEQSLQRAPALPSVGHDLAHRTPSARQPARSSLSIGRYPESFRRDHTPR